MSVPCQQSLSAARAMRWFCPKPEREQRAAEVAFNTLAQERASGVYRCSADSSKKQTD